MFPLLRPPVGTETEINPTRPPSQKGGIHSPSEGGRSSYAERAQTTVAHTSHMARTWPRTPCGCLHTHVFTHLNSYIHRCLTDMQAHPCPTHTQLCLIHTRTHLYMHSAQSHRLASYAHMNTPHCRMDLCTHTHTPTYTHANSPPSPQTHRHTHAHIP